ncbi:MAG: 30S ribosomal protein THX [Chitinophagaceae bacterium]
MGRGDKKTKRGKISMGSFGVTRPARKAKPTATAEAEVSEPKAKAPAKKKVVVKDTEEVAVAKPKKTAKPKSE